MFLSGWSLTATFSSCGNIRQETSRAAAPVLVGRIGWEPHETSGGPGSGPTTLQVSLYVLAILIAISLFRSLYRLGTFYFRPARSSVGRSAPATDEIEPDKLDAWARSMAADDESGVAADEHGLAPEDHEPDDR